MKFEEEFPSLKDIECIDKKENALNYRNVDCDECGTNHMMTFEYFKTIVQKTCLDKKRVLEAIDIRIKGWEILMGKRNRESNLLAVDYCKQYIKELEELKKSLELKEEK